MKRPSQAIYEAGLMAIRRHFEASGGHPCPEITVLSAKLEKAMEILDEMQQRAPALWDLESCRE